MFQHLTCYCHCLGLGRACVCLWTGTTLRCPQTAAVMSRLRCKRLSWGHLQTGGLADSSRALLAKPWQEPQIQLKLIIRTKQCRSWAWCCMPVIPALRRETAGSLQIPDQAGLSSESQKTNTQKKPKPIPKTKQMTSHSRIL